MKCYIQNWQMMSKLHSWHRCQTLCLTLGLPESSPVIIANRCGQWTPSMTDGLPVELCRAGFRRPCLDGVFLQSLQSPIVFHKERLLMALVRDGTIMSLCKFLVVCGMCSWVWFNKDILGKYSQSTVHTQSRRTVWVWCVFHGQQQMANSVNLSFQLINRSCNYNCFHTILAASRCTFPGHLCGPVHEDSMLQWIQAKVLPGICSSELSMAWWVSPRVGWVGSRCF